MPNSSNTYKQSELTTKNGSVALPEDWKIHKLGDVTKWSSGGTPPKMDPSFWDGDIPWISAKSLTGRYVYDSEFKITEAGLKKGSKLALKGSILLLVRGSGLYNDIPVAMTAKDVAYNQDVKCILPKIDELSNNFLLYWFKGNKQTFTNILEATSIGAGKFDMDRVFGLEFNLPPLTEQIAIASILSALDDKIELNLQQNKTLEEMAMALYKHWFVDFGPFQNGEFVESELGLIPSGWKVKSVEELIKIKPINGLFKKDEYQGFGSRWLKMKSVYGLDIITNQEMELISVSENEIVKYGCLYNDIVFGRTSLVLEGIGKCAIIKSVDDIPIFESNLFRIRPDESKISSNILFLYFKSNKGRDEVKKMARQTAAVSITSKDLVAIKIPVPSMEVQNITAKEIDNYILQIIHNLTENQTLTTLRDTLLPKLISGEVRVKEAQQILSSVL